MTTQRITEADYEELKATMYKLAPIVGELAFLMEEKGLNKDEAVMKEWKKFLEGEYALLDRFYEASIKY